MALQRSSGLFLFAELLSPRVAGGSIFDTTLRLYEGKSSYYSESPHPMISSRTSLFLHLILDSKGMDRRL